MAKDRARTLHPSAGTKELLMARKLKFAGLVLLGLGLSFLVYVASLDDEILIREDIRLGGNMQEVYDYLNDVRHWKDMHVPRPAARNEFSENTVGAGAWWLQHLRTRKRKMTIESSDLKGGIKYRMDYGGSQPIYCHMAVRKHLKKGLIFVRSGMGKVSFFERLQRRTIQKRLRSEIYYGNRHLQEKFGRPEGTD